MDQNTAPTDFRFYENYFIMSLNFYGILLYLYPNIYDFNEVIQS